MLNVRIRLFGTISKQDFQVLFEKLITRSEFEEWQKEYFDDNFRLSPSHPAYFTDHKDPASFFRSTYEIIDIGKFHNESFSELTQIEYADLFFQKGILICFQAIAVFSLIQLPMEELLDFLFNSEKALISSVSNFGISVHSCVHSLLTEELRDDCISGFDTFNKIISPIDSKIRSISKLREKTYCAQMVANSGIDRYIYFSSDKTQEGFDEITPYHLLISRNALTALKDELEELIRDIRLLQEEADKISIVKQNSNQMLERLNEIRSKHVLIKKAYGELQAIMEMISIYAEEKLKFIRIDNRCESHFGDKTDLLSYEKDRFHSFFERPIEVLSKHLRDLIGQLENQVLSQIELTSLKINMKVQSLLKWIQILGFIVALLSAVFAGYQIADKYFLVTPSSAPSQVTKTKP